MALVFSEKSLAAATSAFRSWARWPGRDEERLRILVGDEHCRTMLLHADTGSNPRVTRHEGSVSKLWVDISGYVLPFDVDFPDGQMKIESSGEQSAVITVNDRPFVQLVQSEAGEALAPIVVGLGAIPRLQNAQKVQQMTIVDVDQAQGIEAFSQLDYISFRAAVWLTDLQPLAALKKLQRLSLRRARRIKDIQPLEHCHALRWLDLQGCERIDDLTPLSGLMKLEYLNLWRLALLVELSALSGLEALRELQFSRSRKLQDLTPLANLPALETLCLAMCESVSELGPLASAPQLQDLDLEGCNRISDLSALRHAPKLRRLILAGCHSLRDISPLAAAVNLTELDMTSCDAVHDLSALSQMPKLKRLYLGGDRNSGSTRTSLDGLQGSSIEYLRLSRCTSLEDLSPLSKLPKLRQLDLVKCEKLRSLQPLAYLAIERIDAEGCVALENVTVTANLRQLKDLCLNDCRSLSSVEGMEGAVSLEKLEMAGCENVASLEPLRNIHKLQYLDVRKCPELAEPQKWQPLWSLAGLKRLKGAFPGSFVTHLLSHLAVQRKDREWIAEQLNAWYQVVAGSPETAGILASLGQAAELVARDDIIVKLLQLSGENHCSEVEELYRAAMVRLSTEVVRVALRDRAQSRNLNPPAVILALANTLPLAVDRQWAKPLAEQLRNQTLLALSDIACGKQEDRGWAKACAELLRGELDGRTDDILVHGYPVVREVQEYAFAALVGAAKDLSAALFDSLATYHGLHTDRAHNEKVHERLLRFALQVEEQAERHQRLSAMIDGLGRSAFVDWALQAMDQLLEKAAAADPDISTVQAAIVQTYQQLGKWDDAGHLALMIGRPHIRNQQLVHLAVSILASGLQSAARKGLSWASAVTDPVDRRGAIVEVGSHRAAAADPVAYAQAVALLADRPGLQKQVTEKALALNPNLTNAPIFSPAEPITEREKELVRMAFERGRQSATEQ